LDQRAFEEEISRVLDRLPAEFRRGLHNVEIVVEDRPTKAQLRAMGLDPQGDVLYGLYEGTPLPQRSAVYPPILPDKITIFSGTLIRDFRDPVDLQKQVRLTLLHEIAHYFGIDEEEIEKLGY
jgi:predicted Zn-dependent protease with MMP-like domain